MLSWGGHILIPPTTTWVLWNPNSYLEHWSPRFRLRCLGWQKYLFRCPQILQTQLSKPSSLSSTQTYFWIPTQFLPPYLSVSQAEIWINWFLLPHFIAILSTRLLLALPSYFLNLSLPSTALLIQASQMTSLPLLLISVSQSTLQTSAELPRMHYLCVST